MSFEISLEWCGGLFDGEGCVSLCRRERHDRAGHWTVQLSLAMTHRETVERFAREMGCGRIYERAGRGENHRTTWIWIVSARAADHALARLHGHIFTKAEQVALAREARAVQGARTTKRYSDAEIERLDEIRTAIQTANKRPTKVSVASQAVAA